MRIVRTFIKHFLGTHLCSPRIRTENKNFYFLYVAMLALCGLRNDSQTWYLQKAEM